MKNTNSVKLYKEAQESMVGGVNSPVRSFKSVGGDPVIMKKGCGSRLIDRDNNSYTDYCLSWGALILGHSNRNVTLAIKRMAENGTSFGTTTVEEINIADHIKGCMPSIEKIRFVNSGTEATMSAIRLSRGYTKKNIIIKFDGCYHGHFDDLLTCAGSGVAELKESSSQGVPQSHIANTISLPYNDIEAFKNAVSKHHENIACVIIEPVAGNMGVVQAKPEFLKTLRELTKQHNIVLIFDEVMTGFRASSGSVQSDVGITPDITCLGKIIGGGFPVGAYGGKKEIMGCLAPLGDVYQAGTFSGNPVIMKAGLAALRQLNDGFYKKLNEKCSNFVGEMNAFFKSEDLNVHMASYNSMINIRFCKEAVENYDDARSACGGEKYTALFRHLLENGIYWPPAELETLFVSGMHSKKDMNNLYESIVSFFRK